MTPRAATPADFGFIRSMTLRPDFAPFLTDEDEAGLAAYAADPTTRLQIWEVAGQPAGYALWAQIGEPSGAIELRRLGLANPGKGDGLNFLTALTDFGFAELNAAKIWLDVSGENIRAQKVYEKAGFTLEGRQRAHWWRPALGRVVDLMLYGMLRDEWQTLRARPNG